MTRQSNKLILLQKYSSTLVLYSTDAGGRPSPPDGFVKSMLRRDARQRRGGGGRRSEGADISFHAAGLICLFSIPSSPASISRYSNLPTDACANTGSLHVVCPYRLDMAGVSARRAGHPHADRPQHHEWRRHRAATGAQNFLDLDDVPVTEEGEPVEPRGFRPLMVSPVRASDLCRVRRWRRPLGKFAQCCL